MTFILITADDADFYINIDNISMVEISKNGDYMRLYLAHGKFKVTPWIKATPKELMGANDPGITTRYIDYKDVQLKFGEFPEA